MRSINTSINADSIHQRSFNTKNPCNMDSQCCCESMKWMVLRSRHRFPWIHHHPDYIDPTAGPFLTTRVLVLYFRRRINADWDLHTRNWIAFHEGCMFPHNVFLHRKLLMNFKLKFARRFRNLRGARIIGPPPWERVSQTILFPRFFSLISALWWLNKVVVDSACTEM